MLGVVALAGCQAAPMPMPMPMPVLSLGPDRTGYMLFAAPIVDQTAALFQAGLNKLLDLQATQIHVAINSGGGSVKAAEAMIATMDRVHAERGVTFTTHNVGIVGSAACYVFLAGQQRVSLPKAMFMFHQQGMMAASGGIISGQALQEAADQVKQNDRVFLAMLKSRTKIPDAEALSFVHRTVILTADEAKRDGIIQSVGNFDVPPGATVFGIKPKINPASPVTPGTPQG